MSKRDRGFVRDVLGRRANEQPRVRKTLHRVAIARVVRELLRLGHAKCVPACRIVQPRVASERGQPRGRAHSGDHERERIRVGGKACALPLAGRVGRGRNRTRRDVREDGGFEYGPRAACTIDENLDGKGARRIGRESRVNRRSVERRQKRTRRTVRAEHDHAPAVRSYAQIRSDVEPFADTSPCREGREIGQRFRRHDDEDARTIAQRTARYAAPA
jgi:hypothetical protein